jgi:hypothetical protein
MAEETDTIVVDAPATIESTPPSEPVTQIVRTKTIGEAPTDGHNKTIKPEEVPPDLKDKMSKAFKSLEESSGEEEPPSSKSAEKLDTKKGLEQEQQIEKPVVKDGDKESPTEPQEEAKPELPANFIRSLKAAGYTDAEIQDSLKLQGEKFVLYSSRVHEARNRELARWAEAGRQRQQQPPAVTPDKPPQAQPATPTALKPLDITALEKEYGQNQPLIDQLRNVNSAIEKINAIDPVIKQYEEQSRRSANEDYGRRIDSFFLNNDLKPYEDYYGSEIVSDEQLQNRMAVVQQADYLMKGAQAHGQRIKVETALELAHDMLTAKVQKKAVQQEIVSTLKKRESGTTLKPASRKESSSPENRDIDKKTGLKKTDVSEIKQRLDKIFRG